MFKTINAHQMRKINRSAILEYIRVNSPTSRTEISQKLDVSLPTVMRIVDELISAGLVCLSGETESGKGRKRELLEFNENAYSVLGIDLGGTKMYGAIANIGGEILHEVNLEHHCTTGEESFKTLVSLIEKLLEKAEGGPVVNGIAVGAPGITQSKEGIVEWAPSLDWKNYPLKKKLEDHFDIPCFVDNDVNLATLGEQWFGVGNGKNHMMIIALGTGVGGGLILDGALYRGFSGASGEIGYLCTDVDDLGKLYDVFGAFENRVSGTGIRENAIQKLKDLGMDHEDVDSLKVFEAAAENQPWAVEVVEETADFLAMAIANINTLLDLELVVFSGGVSNSAHVLLDKIEEQMTGVIPRLPEIRISSLGRKATVMGAIVLVVHAVDDYYVVRGLS